MISFRKYYLNRYNYYSAVLNKLLNNQFIQHLFLIHLPNATLSLFALALKKKELSIEEAFYLNTKIKERKTVSKYTSYVWGSYLLQNRCYTEYTFNLLKKSAYRNCELNATFRLISFITQTHGYKSKLLLDYIKRLQQTKNYNYLNKRQKIHLYILMCQNKITNNQNLLMYFKKNFNKNLPTSLYFNRKVFKNEVFKYFTEYQMQSSDMYLDVLHNRKKIENIFIKNKNKLCIVGNGPCEIGLNKGSEIDGHALVIRINNYSLDNPNDYGQKVDMWFRVANSEVDNTNINNQKHIVFVGNNFAVKRIDAYKYTLSCKLANSIYTCVPSMIFQELISKLNTLPSTGLVILYWIYKTIGQKIPRKDLYGFSHLVTKTNEEEVDDFKKHYFKDRVQIKNHLHNFYSEISIFMDITE